MDEDSINVLKRLLTTPGPSGDESVVGKLWRSEAKTFADTVRTDVHGNSFALLEGPGPRILLAGHIDEIGLMVNYIDDDGYLYMQPIGGWDAQVLVGQRLRILGNTGDVIGVVGKKPIHLLDSDERSQASKIKHLWVDLGVKNRAEAQELVRVGNVGVIDAPVYEFPNKRLVSRSLDDRIGAFVVLEVLRRLATNRPVASVAAVATTYEEISSAGAAVAACSFEPHVALVVDATYSTDIPESSKKEYGDACLGKGVVLSRGSATNPLVYDRLIHLAEEHALPYSLQPAPSYTGTDADIIQIARSGIATATVSIAMRYLHTPNEMIDLTDVEHTIRLIELFIASVQTTTDFIPDV